MKRSSRVTGILLLIPAIVFILVSLAAAGMTVLLRDGRVMQLPVNKEDVIGISFEEGSLPAAGNITWDFETGDLRGWTATGNAFSTQPTYGDNPTARHRGQPSNHQGNYWIGGGCDMNTERVELIVNGQAVLKASGHCTESMIRVKWNVSAYRGQLAQIRLVDASSGGWGHINFDDVRFE